MRILLLTATKVESNAVLDVFGPGAKLDSKADVPFFDLGKINGARLLLVECDVRRGKASGRIPNVRSALAALRPNEVILVGLAFGMNEKEQAIGEILVSEQLLCYDVCHDGELILDQDRRRASTRLIEWLKSANRQWNSAKVRFGSVLTGEKLAPNFDFREQLLRYEAEAIGGEMDAAGWYISGHDAKA